jgi:methionyl aminopeptidase
MLHSLIGLIVVSGFHEREISVLQIKGKGKNLITIKSAEQIEIIKKAGAITSDCLSFLSLQVQPGMTGKRIDKLCDDFVQSFGGTCACKGYNGYPASICVSINSQAVHCIPDDTAFKPGDVVKLDLVVDYNGWKADSALTVMIPPVRPDVVKLVEGTYSAMLDGIRAAQEGKTVLDISSAIYAARNESGVIKEFTGHGIGKNIHEMPQIPNYPSKDKPSALLVAGMVLCVEPIFCIGEPALYNKPKEWNTWLFSGKFVAHFEHTIIINPAPLPPTVLTLRNNEKIF